MPQIGLAGRARAAAGAFLPGLTMAVTALFTMLIYPTGTSNPAEVRFRSLVLLVGAHTMFATLSNRMQ